MTSFKLRQAGIIGALEAGNLGMGIRVHTPRLMTAVTNIRGERGRERKREREREREGEREWKGRGTGEGEMRTERRGREGTS